MGEAKQKNVLIVMDDIVSELDKNIKFEGIMQLFYNRRHLYKNMNISYIIST